MKAIIHADLVFPDRIVRDGCIVMDGGKIVASGHVTPPAGAEIIDAHGLYAGPGLIDEHCHGYMQYGECIDAADDAEKMAERHLQHGTTTITPTISYGRPVEDYERYIALCNAAVEKGNTTIAGMHYEGPYINPKYGAASDDAWLYDDALFCRLLELGGKNVIHCTYAPEMPGADLLEKRLSEYGVRGDIGHSDAGPADIERAVAAGARICTHLYDAMGNHLGVEKAAAMTCDPQECTSTILLGTPGLYYELICDSLCAHVRPYNIRMALRAGGEDHIVLVTDSTAHVESWEVAKQLPEPYASADDLNFNLALELSGSRLTMNRACVNFRQHTGADLRVTFKCAATNAAKVLGLFDRVGSIDAGKEANVLLVDEDFSIHAIYFRGEAVKDIRV